MSENLAAHPTVDTYNTVFNSEDTFMWLASVLFVHRSVFIAWTDQNGTQYDILFTYQPTYFVGPAQGGIRKTDLFISIMRRCSFGFSVEQDPGTDYGYYAEKLGLRDNSNITEDKLAELFNGVRSELALLSQI